MQSHPLHRTCFGRYQASSATLGWPGDEDCRLIAEDAGLIQKVDRSSLKVSSCSCPPCSCPQCSCPPCSCPQCSCPPCSCLSFKDHTNHKRHVLSMRKRVCVHTIMYTCETCQCSSVHVCTLTSLVDRTLPSSSTYSILTFGRYSLFSGKVDSRSYRESSLQDTSCEMRGVAWLTSWPGENTGKSEGRSLHTKCSTFSTIPNWCPHYGTQLKLHAPAVPTPKYWQVVVLEYQYDLYLSLSLSFCRSYSLWRKKQQTCLLWVCSNTCNHTNMSSVSTVTITTWVVCPLLP